MKTGVFVVVAATLVALAGCSSAESGNAIPGTAVTPPSSPNSPPSTSVAPSSTQRLLPPRPRELDLTGVDPCTDVLTMTQLRQLAYDLGYQRKPKPGTVIIDDGRTCTYSSSQPPDQPSRNIGSLIVIVTSAGAEKWLTDPARQSTAKLSRQTKVAGFPALVLPHPRFADNCGVVVDVHAGQYLDVESSPSGVGKGDKPEPFCAEATRVSEMVIQTLSARR